jgi:hypothetical protein
MRLSPVLLMTAVLSACGGAAATSGNGELPAGPTAAEVASKCVGAEANMRQADEYVGMTEADALALAQTREGGRVVARDADCLGRTRDLREGRANFILSDGRVVWAAVERLPS